MTPDYKNTKTNDKEYVANTYARFDIQLVSGKGSRVFDDTGKEYIDLGTGIAVNTVEDCRAAAQKFFELGVKNVVITLGVRGAYFNDGQREITVPALKVKAVETTGAGDAFNGGFAPAIAEGKDPETALQFATCTAAISVTRLGSAPSMPYRHEILDLMEKEFGVKL